jgi:hypothetical protein
VFESEHVHIEWQKMNFRQPFYPRNVGVDEIGYHISGERTLITEKGTVDLQVGDFTQILLAWRMTTVASRTCILSSTSPPR